MTYINEAINAKRQFKTSVEQAQEYIENFDILETINNVGNDEVFTPVRVCQQILDALPATVWSKPDFKWLNPCDKNGVFLREIALRLDDGLKYWEPNEEARRKHILQKMLFSIGLTRFTAQVSRRTVYYCAQANKQFDGNVDAEGRPINGYAIGNGLWFNNREGNILTPNTEHTFNKQGKCEFCRINSSSKYVDSKQNEHYAYEFLHTKDIERHLQNRFFGGEKMKFDVVIGNPPYQLSDGGQGASAKPLYNLFVEQAFRLNPKYVSMIIPSRWMGGGKGLDDFRQRMITDTRIKELHDFIDHKLCFPNANFIGGVCYFLWEKDYSGECLIVRHSENGTSKSIRYLKEDGVDIVIRDEIQKNILQKVQMFGEERFSTLVSPRKPYGLSGDFIKNPAKYDLPPISDAPIKNGISIWGVEAGKRIKKYLSKDYPLPKKANDVPLWKIFINESDGAAGYIGNPIPARILGTPLIGKPYEICSETFLQIGPFDSEEIAINILSYMKTKFFRFLLGIKKISQHMTNQIYDFVPLQDFAKSMIDRELYEKYALSKEEIEYIECHIKQANW